MDDQLIYYSYQFNSFFLTKIAGDWWLISAKGSFWWILRLSDA
jgi:hypothetical protein